jgi:isoquinoline 1-oxidoreductase
MKEDWLDFTVAPERYEFSEESLIGPLTRRRFFQVLGGGIVVAFVLNDSLLAQPPIGGRRRRGFGAPLSQEISAWLHIGSDSNITAFTGKVELGQNIRTSLAQAIAEELRQSLSRIRLVMADTAQTPFDMGTFGSMTTPVMASQLRRVAAAARELLLDVAAEQTKVARKLLVISDGQVAGPGGKPTLELGRLTKGKKLVKTVGENVPTTPADKWTIAGTSAPKVGGQAIVTGSHQYASDITRPGMLYGKVLRPPAYKATLASVQLEQTEALPHVTVVRDGDFVGVTAPSPVAATEAIEAVHAEWRLQPQPSNQQIFKYLKEHPTAERGFGGRSRIVEGSVAQALATADHQVGASYTVAYIAHVPLETRAALAEWNDGNLTVWTGTQRPFGVRSELASALNLPPERIRVIVPDTGSGYGGKHTGEAALEAARLAKATNKPVKVVWTREEEFTWAYFRPAGLIEAKAGIKKDGSLTAWEFHNYNSGASALNTPYVVENKHVEFHPADSPLRQGSYRALAATANVFARESLMDDLARACGLDPLAFRLKNLPEGRLRDVLQAAAERFGWGKSQPAPGHGFGIAGGTEKGSYVAACAEVACDPAGGHVRVVRVVTAFDCGAVVNPEHLKNQIEGAAMMALGGTLFERIEFADGKILNPSLSAYRVPRFRDMPALETVLVNRKDMPSAGAGETPMVALAPAIANAIAQATGVRLRSLPLAANGLKTL